MLGQTLRRAAVALLLAISGASVACAQNYDGSGLIKFGAFAQGAFLNVDQKFPVVASASPSGFTAGVSVGYDRRIFDRWLLGIEMDGSFGDARDKAGITDYGFDYLFTVRGRLGAYVRPDWLIYGTAGVGFLGMEAHNTSIPFKAEETAIGYVVGAGMEVDWYHVILFGEYLYGDFGSQKFALPEPLLAGATSHRADIQAHFVRLGMKFKVGHDYAHDYDHPDDYRRREPLK